VNKTSIEWTHRPETGGIAGGFTWNPIRARLKGASPKARSGTFCTRISPGCTHCYASTINKRFGTGAEYTVPNLADHEFFIDERILAEPLKRKKPATIFVGDMFDLFHEAIPDDLLTKVFAVIALSSNHTFQVLTKRAERMRDTLDFGDSFWGEVAVQIEAIGYTISPCIGHLVEEVRDGDVLPLKHVWLGVSVEDKPRADERIPLLQQTPAAVRFLSVEPQLEDIDIQTHLMGQTSCGRPNWVICGGESGPGARPFNLAWAESLQAQCKSAGVPFFMKQMGAFPVREKPERITWKWDDRKGGDPSEWPAHLRVREFPA
jgi:protein gp37